MGRPGDLERYLYGYRRNLHNKNSISGHPSSSIVISIDRSI